MVKCVRWFSFVHTSDHVPEIGACEVSSAKENAHHQKEKRLAGAVAVHLKPRPRTTVEEVHHGVCIVPSSLANLQNPMDDIPIFDAEHLEKDFSCSLSNWPLSNDRGLSALQRRQTVARRHYLMLLSDVRCFWGWIENKLAAPALRDADKVSLTEYKTFTKRSKVEFGASFEAL